MNNLREKFVKFKNLKQNPEMKTIDWPHAFESIRLLAVSGGEISLAEEIKQIIKEL